MSLHCYICGSPDPDVDDGRCMDCISAAIAAREAIYEQPTPEQTPDYVEALESGLDSGETQEEFVKRTGIVPAQQPTPELMTDDEAAQGQPAERSKP
jgi:hypothetical protein